MSWRKKFQRESSVFLFVFCGLLPVLIGVSGLFGWVLWCGSMLFCVTFNVDKRDVCVCWLVWWSKLFKFWLYYSE